MRGVGVLAKAVESAPADNSVLYTSATAVVVALIGGAVAIITSRGKSTSHAAEPNAVLPAEINDFWSAEIAKKDARISELEDDVEVWVQRAYESGYRP